MNETLKQFDKMINIPNILISDFGLFFIAVI